MTGIVTLDEAKLFCRVTDAAEDSLFAILISAASDAVLAVADGWDGVGDAPDRLKLAALTRISEAYDNRASLERNGAGELSLLSPLRKIEL